MTQEAAAATPTQPAARFPLLFAQNLFLPADLGGSRYPCEVVRRLASRGHPVTVATPRLHGEFPVLPGVRYRHYRVSRRHPALTHLTNVLGGAVALRAERLARFPVALAGSYDVALALNWGGVVPPTPLVFLFHSQFYSEWVQALGQGLKAVARKALRDYMAAVERRVFHLSARIVAVSAFSARQVQVRAPAVATRVRVVPTGVDTGYFHPPKNKEAAKLAVGLSSSQFLLLGVGRLVAVKQFDRLITAFATARRSGLDARLVIAGDGPERSCLEQLITRLGVAHCVELAGYCDSWRLRELMQAADLQVCSSAFENFSLAILEGMACGTPVLGTPGGGTPELVGAVDASLVLPDDAPDTIAAALGRLADERATLRRLGARARGLAAERYDWERVVDRLESVCAEVTPACV